MVKILEHSSTREIGTLKITDIQLRIITHLLTKNAKKQEEIERGKSNLSSKIRLMKIKLELKPFIKYFILIISVFFFFFSIYVYVTPKYINENPKLIYLCPMVCLICLIGFLTPKKLVIYVFDNYIEKHGVFGNKKIPFQNIKKLILTYNNTLRVISDDHKIEITNDLTNQKEATRFVLTKTIQNSKIKIINAELLSNWFTNKELVELKKN